MPSRGPSPTARAVPVVLAVLTVLAQIAYPLVHGEVLRRLTIATVVLFCAASVTHAAVHRGRAWAAGMFVIAAGGGLAAEAIGVATGVPFGEYAYSVSLGPQVLGVPLVVPLAWAMMAYPCLLLGRRLGRNKGTAAVALLGGGALASWDIFLDPQMVAAGHWLWARPGPTLPGVAGIPLSNFLGWLLVAVLMVAALDTLLPPRRRRSEVVPAALLTWTWAGGLLGNALFFDRPAVALWGGLVMGAFVVPYLLSLWDGRP